ncbi:MAG: hypothetical protein EPO40_19790 [Myxococcaceae bacterium]|nr:MAG: hypothetical protein EPO40_19790 [Myxococcaceae bacterium]
MGNPAHIYRDERMKPGMRVEHLYRALDLLLGAAPRLNGDDDWQPMPHPLLVLARTDQVVDRARRMGFVDGVLAQEWTVMVYAETGARAEEARLSAYGHTMPRAAMFAARRDWLAGVRWMLGACVAAEVALEGPAKGRAEGLRAAVADFDRFDAMTRAKLVQWAAVVRGGAPANEEASDG